MLVSLEEDAVRRPDDDRVDAVPVARVQSHLRALAEAGADEVILVLRPITEESIRALGEMLALDS